MIRPGPYINAETSAGGFPGWLVGSTDNLRDNTTAYFEAWKPYMSAVSQLVAANELSKGGPVILLQVK
jgi:hypothetical protein